jgi:hypothetical protein
MATFGRADHGAIGQCSPPTIREKQTALAQA